MPFFSVSVGAVGCAGMFISRARRRPAGGALLVGRRLALDAEPEDLREANRGARDLDPVVVRAGEDTR